MSRYGMALDTQTCIGCYACTLACKVENANPAGIWTAPVIEKEVGAYPNVRRIYLPLLCNHCADAPCLKACPTGAISRREDGIVLIDEDVCCGSRACVIACPYGAIHYYEKADGLGTPFEEARVSLHQAGTVQKCTLCAPRLDRGLQPACVDACPTGARIFGDLDDPGSQVSRALTTREWVPLGSPVDTAPAVVYLTEGARQAGGAPADLVLPYRHQEQWGLSHAAEFWLLGLGAGLFLASRWLAPGLTVFGVDGVALITLLTISAAGLILIGDLGRPLRLWRALAAWRTNWISRGAIVDFLFLVLVALLTGPTLTNLRTAVGLLAAALAVIVATYPALAMGALKSVPAWRGLGLPLEFFLESLLAGVALTGLLGGWSEGVAPALPSLVALAVLRVAVAAARRRVAPGPARTAAIGAAVTGGLAALAMLVPGGVSAFAGAAALAAAGMSFGAKWANLRSGASPSPFTGSGELASRLHAGH
ncbi:MAG: 4Fe-4S dicluster domain-containing protein [Candidatus Rokubacteria bacterium]|nr:4Fe-4S dicluster domain-containing protein [Candidatus Rokubacteria bacterium]